MVAYVVVNVFLIGTWLVTGMGYFWPGWVLAWAAVAMSFRARRATTLGPPDDPVPIDA